MPHNAAAQTIALRSDLNNQLDNSEQWLDRLVTHLAVRAMFLREIKSDVHVLPPSCRRKRVLRASHAE
ncbi:hypothetical protein E4U43_007798 [Claviceps pusilla]|uniref:Uncharacterized protein n=1 Tax=Claviceps pusilla TaxID=123648 RepID=A0A9P7NC14_9HYPO|nr:hypothetical protein E4U43_007798 [Claviceps pusilla]